MASLRSLLGTKTNEFVSVEEQNLEKGRIYVYTPGCNYSAQIWCGFCFHPEVSGTAILESWGAGGSGAKMCCCGFGLPGTQVVILVRQFQWHQVTTFVVTWDIHAVTQTTYVSEDAVIQHT